MFKKGDRIVITETCSGLGVRKGDTATFIEDGGDNTLSFINTDKLNNYNLRNMNGLHILNTSIELLTGTNFWTAEQVEYLQCHYHRKTIPEIALHFDRSIHSVYCKAYYIGLKKRTRREFNKTDDALLTMLYPATSIYSIAKRMHRSTSAIALRLTTLGLK